MSTDSLSGDGSGERPHILVVDDEASLRDTFEILLVGAGYRVHSSGSADTALRMLDNEHFDTVITDIVMPGGDGLSLLQAVHEQDQERPVILMTGNPSVQSATAAVRGGAFDYLAKPVRKDQLLQSVRRAVDRFTLIEEKRRLQDTNDAQARTLAEYVQRLEALSMAKERMAALLVHDFKNPLSVITSNISLLRHTPELVDLDPDVRACLNDLHHASQGLLRMITMLLDISRMEEEQFQLRPEPVALVDLAESCLGRFRAQAAGKQLRLECEVPRELVLILDRMLLERVLDNMISNGLRYAPRRGYIRISAHVIGRHVALTIENDGPAIPAGMREHIFDKYGQLDPNADHGTANRGLGLYFCRLAAEAHGGRICVEDPPGGGVRFRMDLPVPPAV